MAYANVASYTGTPTIANSTIGGNSYTTYTFTSSGTITFGSTGTVEYLAVAGGGGGGYDVGGGGGAGGLLYSTATVSPTTTTTTNVTADSSYNAQGWVSGSTDYTGSTRVFSYSYGGIQSASGGARTIALPEVDTYFEILITSFTYPLCGLARDTHTGGYNNTPCIYLANGGEYGGLTGGSALGAFNANDILQIAYKASTNKVYFGKNNTWYASPTSTAGASIPGTGTLRFIIMSGSSSGTTAAGTFRSPAQNSYSPPTGYNSLSTTTTSYSITIGAGGAGAASGVVGTNGANSVFGANTAIGGGGGGSWSAVNGASGGSGGGGTSNTTGIAAGTSGQGNNGGAGSGNGGATNDYSGAAGGGGADQAGGNGATSGWSAASTSIGYGGRGKSDTQLGSMLTSATIGEVVSSVRYIAGGGGATSDAGSYYGVGGYGGGGTKNTAGTVNTGGGGGGGTVAGGAGGSGIVVIRVTTAVAPGLYPSANSFTAGSNVDVTLFTANVSNGNVGYTITGVTLAQISTALTGNIIVSSGTGTLTISSYSNVYSSYTMSVSADSKTANITLSPNVSITTDTIVIGTPANTMYYENPISGQMNINQYLTTPNTYYVGGSSLSTYPIDGQMSINDSVVTATDVVLGTQTGYPVTGNIANSSVNSYSTITTTTAGPIPQGIIKVFGDIPQREFWS